MSRLVVLSIIFCSLFGLGKQDRPACSVCIGTNLYDVYHYRNSHQIFMVQDDSIYGEDCFSFDSLYVADHPVDSVIYDPAYLYLELKQKEPIAALQQRISNLMSEEDVETLKNMDANFTLRFIVDSVGDIVSVNMIMIETGRMRKNQIPYKAIESLLEAVRKTVHFDDGGAMGKYSMLMYRADFRYLHIHFAPSGITLSSDFDE